MINIGDKVRLIHSKEEGIVVRLIDSKMVEVEIEEGFSIPVLRQEVALIAKEEATQFKNNTKNTFTEPAPRGSQLLFAEKGIFLAFYEINDQKLSCHLINNTDYELPYTVTVEKFETVESIRAGHLLPKTSDKLKEVSLENFENWGTFSITCLPFRVGQYTPPAPFVKHIRLKASYFFKSKQKAPVIDKNAYLFQLDKEETPATLITPTETIDVQTLKEKMFEKNEAIEDAKTSKSTIFSNKPTYTIDLHIEQLTEVNIQMDNASILEIQMRAFEKGLDEALLGGASEVIFIHGVGNGTLRSLIHKQLSNHPHVQYYQDAQKEKFGYGATKVKLK
ncbi:MAG: DUF2027 domain-containing protein [Cytophagales bacterium]|nr:MAG: DUF2027 domain-containing protein [Cytophagales bacterium]